MSTNSALHEGVVWHQHGVSCTPVSKYSLMDLGNLRRRYRSDSNWRDVTLGWSEKLDAVVACFRI